MIVTSAAIRQKHSMPKGRRRLLNAVSVPALVAALALMPAIAQAAGGAGGAGSLHGGADRSGSGGGGGGTIADPDGGGGENGIPDGAAAGGGGGGGGGPGGGAGGSGGAGGFDSIWSAGDGGDGGDGGAHGYAGTDLPGGDHKGGDGQSGFSGEGADFGGGGGGGGAGGYGAVVDADDGVEVSAAQNIIGGAGGAGGAGGSDGGIGGSGGDGGIGLALSGTNLINSGRIVGGDGGDGGAGGADDGAGSRAGNGGDGGAGLSFSGVTLNNSGRIAGGAGGVGGSGDFPGDDGAGGVGVVVEDSGSHVITSGTIAGGLGGNGSTRANAMEFRGGGNRLELRAGYAFDGRVVANGGANDTLALGGDGEADFDLDLIGDRYRGFETFEKTGGGTWTLTGTGSQGWAVAAGTLAVNGTGGAMTVGDGGTLAGSGTVGDTTVGAGGTLSPGNSIGELTVAGDLSFDANSVFEVEVDPETGESDHVDVTGSASLAGSVVHIGLAGDYAENSRYRILTAAGGVSGAFDGASSQFHFLDADLLYEADGVDLALTRNDVGFQDLGETPNQQATAAAVEALGAGDPLYDAVVTQGGDPAALQQAYDLLSGDPEPSTRTALMQGGRLVRGLARTRTRQVLGGGNPQLAALAPGVQVASAEPMAGVTAAARVAPDPSDRVWAQAFGGWGRADGEGNAARTEHATGGLLLGVDGEFGAGWTLGVLAGYSRTGIRTDDRAAESDADSYHLGLYGGRDVDAGGPGTLTLTGGATFAWHEVDAERTVAFPGFAERLTAEYSAQSYQLFGEAGYVVETEAATVEPYAGLSWLRHRTESHDESGGASALSRDASTERTLFSTIGLRAAREATLGGTDLVLRGGVGWRHAFGDRTPTVSQRFRGGETFSVAGTPIARNAAIASVGLDFAISEATTLTVAYDGQLAADSQDHGGRLELSVLF
ncbi:MAG TPA: autotransporter domain-containing protein [Alphaproteobacteria bacterium]|nr:autotransporter domain-containing protein [Alphaproteobacteria bacterium]